MDNQAIWKTTTVIHCTINVLPSMLKDLHDRGEDLSGVIDAVHEIEDEQRKRSLAERLKAATKNIDVPLRRFIIAYSDDGKEVKTAGGVQYDDGSLDISMDAPYPLGGRTRNRATLEDCTKRDGYVIHIEYID